MTTTTKLGDWLGRSLRNWNPGTSDASDWLGRAVTAGDKDSMGRSLTNTPNYPPPDWATGTAYSVGDRRKIPGTKEIQTLTSTGTPTGNLKLGVDRGDGQGVLPTANIAVATISAANIQAALVALPNVDPGDVVVSGGASPWTMTWESELGNIAAVSVDNAGVSSGSYAVATSTQGAVNEQVLEVTVAGTSHASTKPVAPAVGTTVTDNTVTWIRLK